MKIQFKKIVVFLLAVLFMAPAFVRCTKEEIDMEPNEKLLQQDAEQAKTVAEVLGLQLKQLEATMDMYVNIHGQYAQMLSEHADKKAIETAFALYGNDLPNVFKALTDASQNLSEQSLKTRVGFDDDLLLDLEKKQNEMRDLTLEIMQLYEDWDLCYKGFIITNPDCVAIRNVLNAKKEELVKKTAEYQEALTKVMGNLKIYLHDIQFDGDWEQFLEDNPEIITALGNVNITFAGANITIAKMIELVDADLTRIKQDLYGDESNNPDTGGIKAKVNEWLWKNYGRDFLKAMRRDLGLINPGTKYVKFERINDVFEQLKVIKLNDNEYSSLLLEALLADMGEVLQTTEGVAYFQKWDAFKNQVLSFVNEYKGDAPDAEYKTEYDNYFKDEGATKDNVWKNIQFLIMIAKDTNFKARRMWAGLEMQKKQVIDPNTLQPTGDAKPNDDGSFNYESALVMKNKYDIMRLKNQIDIVNKNISTVYETIGSWVTDIEFIPNYVNNKQTPYVPFRFIRDEKNTVSGYFNLVYDISPSNAKLDVDYTVESVDVVATPQTRSAAGDIHFVNAFVDSPENPQRITVKVYVENIDALVGKNLGFMLKVRNTNATLQEYNPNQHNTPTDVNDETIRIVRSAIVYGEVTENEVGVASRKDKLDIDQRFVVRKVGETDESALKRAKDSDTFIEFISHDDYSYDLAERLFPFVYDDKQEISLLKLKDKAEQFVDYKLTKAELVGGEDSKYLSLNGTILQRRKVIGGVDQSFGKFQYVKLTYVFTGFNEPFDQENDVTRVAYVKLKMTNPAAVNTKEYSFTTTFDANTDATEELMNHADVLAVIGFNADDFYTIYGDPTIEVNKDITEPVFEATVKGQPKVTYTKDTPVGEYKGVYKYTANGYPDVVVTWVVKLALPGLKVKQISTDLKIDVTDNQWQYLPIASLFRGDGVDPEFNGGEVDDYYFSITKLPAGFRLVKASDYLFDGFPTTVPNLDNVLSSVTENEPLASGNGYYLIVRSNPELHTDDVAALFTGKQILFVPEWMDEYTPVAAAEFWQGVRRINGLRVNLVAVRGSHETIVGKNFAVNFTYNMYFDPAPGSHTFDNGLGPNSHVVNFDLSQIKWTDTSLAHDYFGVKKAPAFTGEAFVKNNDNEYVKLADRFMNHLTIPTAVGGGEIKWDSFNAPIPNQKLTIYLPVKVDHSFGSYVEYFELTIIDKK